MRIIFLGWLYDLWTLNSQISERKLFAISCAIQ